MSCGSCRNSIRERKNWFLRDLSFFWSPELMALTMPTIVDHTLFCGFTKVARSRIHFWVIDSLMFRYCYGQGQMFISFVSIFSLVPDDKIILRQHNFLHQLQLRYQINRMRIFLVLFAFVAGSVSVIGELEAGIFEAADVAGVSC